MVQINLLPGTNRASDPYVRAAYYINAARQTSDPEEAVATVVSVIRNASVPRGLVKEGEPNTSSTIWRSFADQKNRRYFYEDTARTSIVWVDFNQLDFSKETQTKKVFLGNKEAVLGDVTNLFTTIQAFDFIGD